MSDETSQGGEPLSDLEIEKQMLSELNAKPFLSRYAGYVKLSGPGWLQSALTLGGGSLASGLYLGVLTGYSLLWLQPFAMILGIIMLSSLSYLTLSTGERTFRAVNNHVSPVLGWGWLIGSMMANIVWALPQYSLATAAIQQNLLPGVFGAEGSLPDQTSKYIIVGFILAFSTLITWSYGSGHWGVRLYEKMLKIIVACIVFCFVGVVVRLLFVDENLNIGDLLTGFIPSWSALTQPPEAYQSLLNNISEEHRQYWTDYILSQQFDVAMAAFATAVGINMTFLLACSLISRGWGKEHRSLSIFDLSTGMFIPFLLATTCVVVAAASQFHSKPYPGLIATAEGTLEEGQAAAGNKVVGAYNGILTGRLKLDIKKDESVDSSGWDKDQWAAAVEERKAQLTQPEKELAATLVKRNSFDLSKALEPLLQGSFFANIVFGLGVLGMAMSTISLLMLISGFVVCEVMNVPAKGWPFRLGTLAAATGALGPFFWGEAAPYLAIPTSVFGLVLLPIAYASFFFLINQKSYMKDEVLRGGKKLFWNVLMFCSTFVAFVASGWAVWKKVGMIGLAGMAIFLIAAIATRRKGPQESETYGG